MAARAHSKSQCRDSKRPDVSYFSNFQQFFSYTSEKMVMRWCNSASTALLLALFLSSCLATSGGALTDYGKADDNATLPETTSLQGALQGVNMLSYHNRTFYGFKGIPYAEPPVGDLRFKAPVAAGSWNGTFNASSDGNVCPQTSGDDVIGDEDCLILHVFTPKLPTSDDSTLLPVIVFIFGGAFEFGYSTSYGPNFLLDKDVVYVSPNFRVGVLGYLTTGDEASPGNYALKDIVLALKWIQDNIQYFGGDPNRVTLHGQSSGAMSVSLLTLVDSTNGLFHQIITDSGTALNLELTPTLENHVNRTYRLAEYFSCSIESSTILVDCLRGINASQLIANSKSIFYVWESLPKIFWFPSVEPDIEGALLTDTFANLFKAGKHRDVPWISLVDEIEDELWIFQRNSDVFEVFLANIDSLLPYFIGYFDSADNVVTTYTNALKSYYLNDLTADRSTLLTNLTEMISDAKFYYPAYHMFQQQLTVAKKPLYFACFGYLGSFTNKTQTVHMDELYYVFDISHDLYNDVDWSMVDTMVQLWTSFVINGTPTIEGANNTAIWEPYSPLKNYLQIGNGSDIVLKTKYDLYSERMQVWEKLAASTSGKSRI